MLGAHHDMLGAHNEMPAAQYDIFFALMTHTMRS